MTFPAILKSGGEIRRRDSHCFKDEWLKARFRSRSDFCAEGLGLITINSSMDAWWHKEVLPAFVSCHISCRRSRIGAGRGATCIAGGQRSCHLDHQRRPKKLPPTSSKAWAPWSRWDALWPNAAIASDCCGWGPDLPIRKQLSRRIANPEPAICARKAETLTHAPLNRLVARLSASLVESDGQ